jgi:hypothetical protein
MSEVAAQPNEPGAAAGRGVWPGVAIVAGAAVFAAVGAWHLGARLSRRGSKVATAH